MTEPAVERCEGCNMTRVYCQAVAEMQAERCCRECSH